MSGISSLDLVDPELRSGIDLFPATELSREGLDQLRALTSTQEATPLLDGLVEQRLTLNTTDGSFDIIVSRPSGDAVLPAVCCLHGGGFITGSAAKMAAARRPSSIDLNAVMVYVDYRLAPEHPFPAPLEDCYRALGWMANEGSNFGIDPARIAVCGISAGGGLAAGLAILARDRGEYAVICQHLLCPMLDDRTPSHPDPHPHVGEFVWTGEHNYFGWSAFLGHEPGGEAVSSYAAPARIIDMRGLPPAYLAVGTLDLFLEENLDYARRLTRAGVPVEMHVYPGVYHGASAVLDAQISQRWERDSGDALRRALHQ
jgi:acetyl esterase/lipase